MLQRVGVHISYWRDVLPALLVFALGLSITVAPLTAAVLADATQEDAGIASGVNNAVARVAGLMGTAAVGAAVSASFVANLNGRVAGVALDTAGAGGARAGHGGCRSACPTCAACRPRRRGR